MVSLSNVDNASDAGKPISNATQTALDNKQNSWSSTTDVTVRDMTASTCTFSLITCTGTSGKSINNARGIYIGLDHTNAGGIEICADVVQYII